SEAVRSQVVIRQARLLVRANWPVTSCSFRKARKSLATSRSIRTVTFTGTIPVGLESVGARTVIRSSGWARVVSEPVKNAIDASVSVIILHNFMVDTPRKLKIGLGGTIG